MRVNHIHINKVNPVSTSWHKLAEFFPPPVLGKFFPFNLSIFVNSLGMSDFGLGFTPHNSKY